MSEVGRQALPMSGVALRDYAQNVRDVLGLKKRPKVDCVILTDLILPQALDGFECEVREYSQMLSAEGYASPDDRRIILREDVYVGACEGKGRDRFTVAHEIGHILLHSTSRLVLPRTTGRPPTYACPEWQANTFASEFLIDGRQVPPGCDEEDIAALFGVTPSAARVWISRNWGKA